MGTRDTGTFWNMNGKGMVLACPLKWKPGVRHRGCAPRAQKRQSKREERSGRSLCLPKRFVCAIAASRASSY